MRMLFAAYQKPVGQPMELTDAFQTTISDSRRDEFERLAGKTGLTDVEVDRLREMMQISLAARVKPPVLVKSHNARVRHNGFPLIRRELTLGAVYMVRNPLDVVDSVADHWGCSIDDAIAMMNNPQLSIGGQNDAMVRQYLQNWSLHVASWIDQPAFPTHVVRYEDLKSSTELTFRNVLTFLGWPLDSQRIAHAIEQTNFKKLQQQEANHGFAETSKCSIGGRFFRNGNTGHGVSMLTSLQYQRIVKQHGAVMERIGYTNQSQCVAHHIDTSDSDGGIAAHDEVLG
jgi:hypothetical protein